MFRSSGAARKWSSMAFIPSSISRKRSGPIASMSDRPTADASE